MTQCSFKLTFQSPNPPNIKHQSGLRVVKKVATRDICGIQFDFMAKLVSLNFKCLFLYLCMCVLVFFYDVKSPLFLINCQKGHKSP